MGLGAGETEAGEGPSAFRFQIQLACCVRAKLIQSCPRLFVTPWTVARQAPVHGILQAGVLSGLPFPPPGGLPDPGLESMSQMSPALAAGCSITGATWEQMQSVTCSAL